MPDLVSQSSTPSRRNLASTILESHYIGLNLVVSEPSHSLADSELAFFHNQSDLSGEPHIFDLLYHRNPHLIS
jgi:hypothetical protein